MLDKRREMAFQGKIDWAFGELLALGSLVAEGKRCGCRAGHPPGTFIQRHSVIIDRRTGQEFIRYRSATKRTAPPAAASSWSTTRRFSEFATLGFEYGY